MRGCVTSERVSLHLENMEGLETGTVQHHSPTMHPRCNVKHSPFIKIKINKYIKTAVPAITDIELKLFSPVRKDFIKHLHA